MAITDVVNALNAKTAKPETVMPAVEKIASDNNANATPQKNAMDIDTLAVAILILSRQVQEIANMVMAKPAPAMETEDPETEE